MQTSRPVALEMLETLSDRQTLHADPIKQIPAHLRIKLRWVRLPYAEPAFAEDALVDGGVPTLAQPHPHVDIADGAGVSAGHLAMAAGFSEGVGADGVSLTWPSGS